MSLVLYQCCCTLTRCPAARLRLEQLGELPLLHMRLAAAVAVCRSPRPRVATRRPAWYAGRIGCCSWMMQDRGAGCLSVYKSRDSCGPSSLWPMEQESLHTVQACCASRGMGGAGSRASRERTRIRCRSGCTPKSVYTPHSFVNPGKPRPCPDLHATQRQALVAL